MVKFVFSIPKKIIFRLIPQYPYQVTTNPEKNTCIFHSWDTYCEHSSESNKKHQHINLFCHFVQGWTFPPNIASSALLCFWTVTCSCQYLRYTHMRLPFFLLSMFNRSAQCLSLLKISFRSDSRFSSVAMGSLTTFSSMFFSISSRWSRGWMREQ